MTPENYQAYIDSLVALANHDERIVGLVLHGSTAATHHQPDQWSDHDFWLVVRDGSELAFHEDLSWIPQYARAVLAFRETRHGWKVVFNDGHVLEYAVFPVNELAMARFFHHKLLVDKIDLRQRLDAIQAQQASESTHRPTVDHVHNLLSLIVIGMGRYHRGEQMSSLLFLKHHALEQLHAVIQAVVPPQQPHLVDPLSPSRRIEQTHPQLADALHAIITASVPDAADKMVDMVVSLSDQIPDFPYDAIDMVRRVIHAH